MLIFTLGNLLKKALKKYSPEKVEKTKEFMERKWLSTDSLTSLIDVITMIFVVVIAFNPPEELKPETLLSFNEKFESLILTLILSIILSAAIGGKLFNKKNKQTSISHKKGINLLLIGIPILLIFVPVLFIGHKNAAGIQLFFNYIIFSLLVKLIMEILTEVYKDKLDD